MRYDWAYMVTTEGQWAVFEKIPHSGIRWIATVREEADARTIVGNHNTTPSVEAAEAAGAKPGCQT